MDYGSFKDKKQPREWIEAWTHKLGFDLWEAWNLKELQENMLR
jgi:hypothetical protein